MKELFQNTEINNMVSFLKNSEVKNLKKFTIRPNYFYKPLVYLIYSNTTDPFPNLFHSFWGFFLRSWFPSNRLLIKKNNTNNQQII